MAKEFKRYLVTSALPYANGPVHIGHLAGVYIPSDIYTRYLRLKGCDVISVCGSDEHGVPITIKARKEGVTPQQIVDRYHELIKRSFEGLGMSFDIYSRTSSATHARTASDFFRKLYDEGKFIEKTSMQYYDEEAQTFLADRYIVGTCPKCGGSHFTQDPDTLDTWFSSALWPFSTLGWPNEDSADLKYFYPTNTLVTGYDIIGFWVSRMIFSGLAYTGKAPFDTVCIHGIVRDSQGRKMSKSLGNGIDPLEVIAQYGADALRFMLLDGSTPGNDMRYSEKKVEAARNFANKLWNATRFVLMNLPEDFQPGLPEESKLDMSDKWVLTKLNQVAGAMTDNLDHFEMGLAAAKINSFIWDVYCDWFIEIAKPRLNSGDAEQADTARRVLVYVLDKALKLLHPFMPFITEELYQALPGSAETIMTQSWPTFDEAHNWAEEEEAFEKVMDYIKAVRTMRTEMNVHPAKKTSMIIETADPAPFRNAEVYLAKFAFATDVTFTEKYEGSTDGMVQVSTHTARGFIPMMELIDREKELARLNKEKAKAEKELAMFGNQLNNPKFVERAPAALVEEIRAKRTNSQSKLANIEQSIKALG